MLSVLLGSITFTAVGHEWNKARAIIYYLWESEECKGHKKIAELIQSQKVWLSESSIQNWYNVADTSGLTVGVKFLVAKENFSSYLNDR